MSNGQVTSKEICFIGAIGGLCLSLLKLIESGFFIGNLWSTTSVAAYCTYFVYIFFGIVVAFYFTERSVASDKIKKNALILGLLAPSLLLALAARPVGQGESVIDTLKGLPRLGNLIAIDAYAESSTCPEGTIVAPDGKCIKGEEIKKKEVEPTLGQAFLNAIGRIQPSQKYAFVVGVTNDGAKAEEVAKNINERILRGEAAQAILARVVKPEGRDIFFVSVGGLSTPSEVLKIKALAESSAIDVLSKTGDPVTKSSAELLLKGKVVEGQVLFEGKI
jgi:hypothetical protein